MNTITKCPICNKKYVEAEDEACDSCLGLKGKSLCEIMSDFFDRTFSPKSEFEITDREKDMRWVDNIKFTNPEQKEEFVKLYEENYQRTMDAIEQEERHDPLNKTADQVDFSGEIEI